MRHSLFVHSRAAVSRPYSFTAIIAETRAGKGKEREVLENVAPRGRIIGQASLVLLHSQGG